MPFVAGVETGGVVVVQPAMISTIIIAIRRLLLGSPFSFKASLPCAYFFPTADYRGTA